MLRPPPRSPLFPYTTLFRSSNRCGTCLSYQRRGRVEIGECPETGRLHVGQGTPHQARQHLPRADLEKTDRKSTRLNSSHVAISYAVFCLKKKNKTTEAILAR